MVRVKEKSSGPVQCPACNHTLKSRKGLPLHLKSCSLWDLKFDIPYSEFDFDRHYQTGVWASGAQEGVDYVECYICRDSGTYHRRRSILDHVKAHHDLNKQEYLAKYPDAITTCSDTYQKRVATVNANWGVDNVFQAEEIKAKFDILETAWNPDSREKRAKTNLAKYGHENLFGGSEGVQRAREGMLAKYGKAFPAHVPEIQGNKKCRRPKSPHQGAKRKSANIKCPNCHDIFVSRLDRDAHVQGCEPWSPDGISPCVCCHRATSPQQMQRHKKNCREWQNRDVEKISKIRYEDTMLRKYGVRNPMESPEIRERMRQTNITKWGVENPFQSEIVKEKISKTHMKKRGVLFASQDPLVKEKARQTVQMKYGVDSVFQSPEIREKIKESMLANWGHENPNQVPEIRDRVRQTNLERYGSEEVLSSHSIRLKIRQTCENVYGGSAPACHPDVQEKIQNTNLERYGVPFTSMVPEVREKQRETVFRKYGDYFFATPKGREKMRKGMLAKYGIEYSLQDPDTMKKVLEKRICTWEEKYGVTHHFHDPEVLSKFLSNRMP